MKTRIFFYAIGIVVALAASMLQSTPASGAQGLRVLPLTYQESLDVGEVKKGFVDVINNSSSAVDLTTSVKAFRQIDDRGNLEFYDSDQVRSGITPDLDSFKLVAGQGMRLYFQVDGGKLPTGDVFAALFVATLPDRDEQIDQSVRVGTLLMLENGTPPSRQADITHLDSSFLHIGNTLSGKYSIKNTAASDQATGFMPTVSIDVDPFGKTTEKQSSLIFAGRERINEFSIPISQVGIYKLSVAYDDSSKSRWVLLVPSWALFSLMGLLLIMIGWRVARRRGRSRRKTENQPSDV